MPELTLPEILQRAATEYPQLGIYYFQDDFSMIFQSYPDLLAESGTLAGGLLKLGVKAGDKVIIATENNKETITLLWGCFLAGIVPTILQPPVSFSVQNASVAKFLNVFRLLGNPFVFTSHKFESNDNKLQSRIVPYYQIEKHLNEIKHEVSLDDLAFIQFSSGSTGDPKGIMLTHRNISINLRAIIKGLDIQPRDPIGNWMPLYHDMGLIGYHLTPLRGPSNQYHILTTDYIKNPALWPEMMSRCKITITGCPNFGQELLIRYLKRRPEGHSWDLSHLKALLNGAEPISVKVMTEFNQALKPYGFKEEAMMPVYGMAEATLAISFTPLMEPSVVTTFDSTEMDRNQKAVKLNPGSSGKHGRTITGVGVALQDIEIRITDHNDEPIVDANVGHIQVKGGSITQGYFLNQSGSMDLFCNGWLRTGDMGFVFEGNLYISGRYKDIIFVNGKNYFANDLETLACSLEEFSFGKIIIGGITDFKTGKEKVLIFAAAIPEAKAAEMLEKLRALMRKELGIPIDELILIKSNEIPKTSSGKIQRYKVLQRYQQGDFDHLKFR
jgi:acyl-CoA synthetase (AMP-forming)/AMP-acid ligase II